MHDVPEQEGPDPLMILPTWIRRLTAHLGGYFWLPCPLCQKEFGGHEWADVHRHFSSIPDGDSMGHATGICPKCTAAGLGCLAHATLGEYHWECEFVEAPDARAT